MVEVLTVNLMNLLFKSRQPIKSRQPKKFSKYILSFEQASIEHGGDGAFYVYLRKNKN